MSATKDQAISLRRLDYSETSQVLVFLTREHGRQRLIAKGIKRSTKVRFATGIDLLERGEVVFIRKPESEAGLGTLTEWLQADLHLGLRADLHRLYAGQYAAEITAAMTEDSDPHPELFDALARLLADAAAGHELLPAVVQYQHSLLASAGLFPDLGRCVTCDKPAPAGRAGYFSAQQGGLVCSACAKPAAERRLINAGVLNAIRGQSWSCGAVREVFDLFNYTIAHAMGKLPKLAKLI